MDLTLELWQYEWPENKFAPKSICLPQTRRPLVNTDGRSLNGFFEKSSFEVGEALETQRVPCVSGVCD